MFEKLFDRIKNAIDANSDRTPEEMDKMFFDENGKPREEVFGNVFEDLKKELSGFMPAYEPMDFSDLSKISDDDIYDNLHEILFDDNMNDIKKVAHIIFEFDMEFSNGGVSQYFANTRGEHTLELAESLEKIGATKYAKACGDFIRKYNIKPSDFDDNIKNYFKIAESMYPYEELENAIEEFYMTDLLQDYIVKYVREHATEII